MDLSADVEVRDASAKPALEAAVTEEKPGQRTIADFCYDLLTRHEIAFVILLLVTAFVYAVLNSHRKLFWYDELFTVIVATQPTWHRFAQAMPADGNPPLGTLLTRLSIHIFGLTDFAVRLPSMLAFLTALFEIYIFVRRECGAVFGLLAMTLMLAQPAWASSFEGSPIRVAPGVPDARPC